MTINAPKFANRSGKNEWHGEGRHGQDLERKSWGVGLTEDGKDGAWGKQGYEDRAFFSHESGIFCFNFPQQESDYLEEIR